MNSFPSRGPRVYFDTSAWNHLTKEPKRDALTVQVRQQFSVVFASVISVAEVLLTPDLKIRRSLSGTIGALHGDWPLLERPLDLASSAAEGFFHGKRDFLMKSTPPGESLLSQLLDPSDPDIENIRNWLGNTDRNMGSFIEGVKPEFAISNTKICSLDFMENNALLSALCAFPSAKAMHLTPSQTEKLCRHCDVWCALRATLAAILDLSFRHSPKRMGRRQRPGGPDLWQAVYLGCVDMFVVNDTWMREVISDIASLLPYRRRVMSPNEFYQHLL
ncbi:MAG: hypothetical protein DMG05_14615 [Acidobacteria bacterium]|nr:MAG: hypothetical protein DMG05_14615 [Acidobacteriota bacterium]